jgi:hypothetical protein
VDEDDADMVLSLLGTICLFFFVRLNEPDKVFVEKGLKIYAFKDFRGFMEYRSAFQIWTILRGRL